MVEQYGDDLVFLLSLPRSGSTLLSVMLDNHPEISSPTEPWIMLALHQLAHVDVRHPANAQSVGKAIRSFTTGEAGKAAVRSAACTLYNHARGSKPLLIDKTPRYYLILDYLTEIFPKARYLWLIRNPFDIAASYKTTWGVDLPSLIGGRCDDSNVFDFVVGLEQLEAFAGTMGPQAKTVHYESLTADPTGVLAEVLDFLGYPTDAETLAALTDLSHQKRTPDDFGDPKILKTTAPHTQSIGSWETQFTLPELQILFDAVGRGRLERLGYAETVERLLTLGVEDRGPEVTRSLLEHIRTLIAARYGDIESVTTHGLSLSHHIQERARYAVAGDAAWDSRYADRVTLDQTLAFIEQERAEYTRQHGIQAAEIAKRDLMVKERDEEIGNRGRHIALLNDRIALLDDRITALEDERNRLNKAIQERDHSIERLRSALATVEEACNSLRATVQERDGQIASLMNSTSWKLTAPLRAITGQGKQG